MALSELRSSEFELLPVRRVESAERRGGVGVGAAMAAHGPPVLGLA